MADPVNPFALSEEDASAYAALRQGRNPWDETEKPEPDIAEIAEDDPETAADVIEAETEGEPDKPTDPPKKRFENVPFKVFEAQKKAAQEAKRELQAERERVARDRAVFEERLSLINAMMGDKGQAQAEPDVAPDPETDIFGHAKWQAKQLEKIQQQTAEQQRVAQQQNQVAQLRQAFQAAEQDFRSKTPDYDEAVSHLVELRRKEMEILGWRPDQIPAALAQEVDQLAANAFRSQRNPAELAYELAKAKGWTKKADADGEPAAKQKLDTVAKGQAASKTLSATSGKAGKPELTVESLLEMPDWQFKEWAEKNYSQKNQPLKRLLSR